MLKSLTEAIRQMLLILAPIHPSLRKYDNPPASISEYPALLGFAEMGQAMRTPAGLLCMHALVAEILESNTVTPETVSRAQRWPDLVIPALAANDTLNGSVEHIVWTPSGVTYELRAIRYANAEYFGARFRIPIKIMEQP